jgi:phosphoserine phosphatase RsbU/P
MPAMESPPRTTDPTSVDLRTLVGHSIAVSADTIIEAVQSEFARTNTDFIAVVDDGQLLGVCARRELIHALSARYGYALNARLPVRNLLMAAPLRVTVGVPVTDVFRSAAGRAERDFYDDVLLVDESDRYVGMIPMRILVRLQTEFLLGNIVTLEASRREIAGKNEEMEKDLLMAREVQLAMLPQAHAPIHQDALTLQFAHRFRPAGGVSGDFFDVLLLSENRAGILVCDVMGHGVRSALISAMVRAMVEEFRPIAGDPAAFLTRVNRDLTAILKQTGSLIFVTAAYVVVEPRTQRLRYSQAGHPTPLLWDGQLRAVRPIACSEAAAGPALGLIGDFEFASTESSFAPNDRLFLYTDGVTEAPALTGEEFGVARFGDSLVRHANQPLDPALAALLSELTLFCGSLSFPDDVCLVAAEMIQGGQPGALP